MTRYSYSLLILLLALFACEETIVLDLDQAPTKVVIEGLLTNRAEDQFVQVTRTVDFYSTALPEKVTNAIVKVTTSDGVEIPYKQFSPGFYIPQNAFSGVVGKRYKLTVVVDGITYTSEDELLRVAPVDSVGYRPVEEPTKDQIASGKNNELLLYFQEPKDTDDFYMFKFFRNDSLTYNDLNDIYIVSDEVLAESILGFPSPVTYAEGDTARMEMMSITRNGYLYYSDLTNLLFSDGGLFGPVPANPRTNLSNGALGFFQVSAITTKELILKK